MDVAIGVGILILAVIGLILGRSSNQMEEERNGEEESRKAR